MMVRWRMMAALWALTMMCSTVVAQQGEQTDELIAGQKELKKEMSALKGEVTALRAEIKKLQTDLSGMSANLKRAAAPQPTAQPKRPAEGMAGETAPQFDLTTYDGNKVKIGGNREAPQVLFCYASWCGFCKRAIPGINTMYEKYKAKGVEVLAVNLDARGEGGRAKSEQESLDTYKGLNLSLPMTMTTDSNNTQQVGAAYKAQSFPTLFVLGKTGKVESVHIGAKQGLEDIVAKEIDLLMEGKPLPKQ